MKIISPEHLSSGRSTCTKIRHSRSAGFHDLLQQYTSTEQIPVTPSAGTLPEISSVHTPGPINSDARAFKSATDTTLDLFDSYIRQLNDPETKLKEIEPTLKNLVNQAESLHSIYVDSDTCPPQLKQLLDHLLMETKLEQIKFQRGDYVD